MIFICMESELIHFIKSYLYETFSIDKIKDRRNKKFKRGINMGLDRVTYVDNGRLRIRNEVEDQLKDIFNVDGETISKVMLGYLTEDATKKKKGRPTKKRPSQTPI